MKGKSKKTFAILISAIMGISSLSMDTSPLMAKEREQYVLTEDNHSTLQLAAIDSYFQQRTTKRSRTKRRWNLF